MRTITLLCSAALVLAVAQVQMGDAGIAGLSHVPDHLARAHPHAGGLGVAERAEGAGTVVEAAEELQVVLPQRLDADAGAVDAGGGEGRGLLGAQRARVALGGHLPGGVAEAGALVEAVEQARQQRARQQRPASPRPSSSRILSRRPLRSKKKSSSPRSSRSKRK